MALNPNSNTASKPAGEAKKARYGTGDVIFIEGKMETMEGVQVHHGYVEDARTTKFQPFGVNDPLDFGRLPKAESDRATVINREVKAGNLDKALPMIREQAGNSPIQALSAWLDGGDHEAVLLVDANKLDRYTGALAWAQEPDSVKALKKLAVEHNKQLGAQVKHELPRPAPGPVGMPRMAR